MPPIIPDFSDDGKAVCAQGQKSFTELQALVIDWAKARKIIPNARPHVQLMKTGSELGELFDAEIKGDMPGIIDGIGDVLVTLIIYSELKGAKLPVSWLARNGVKGSQRTLMDAGYEYGWMLDEDEFCGTRTVSERLSNMINVLNWYAQLYDLTLADCLASAYNEIKDRTGTLLENGVFVKDEPSTGAA